MGEVGHIAGPGRAWPLTSVVALIVAIVVQTGAASGAERERFVPGDTAGEALVAVPAVVVERASLLIDLRRLERDGWADVTATYRLENRGARRGLEVLVPVSPGRDSAAEVTADGRRVRPTPGGAATMPRTWLAPPSVPAAGGGGPVPYRAHPTRWQRFVAPLAPGAHDLEVRYSVRATAYAGEEPTLQWQLAYVLSPARGWDPFAGLDVLVQAPPGWRAATAPDLQRAGDVLARSFAEVPADALAISVQAPPPAVPPPVALGAYGGAAVVVAAGALGGRALRLSRRPAYPSLFLSALLAGSWASAMTLALVRADAARLVPARQLSWNADTAWWAFGLAPLPAGMLTLVLGFLLAQLAGSAGYRWGDRRRRTPRSGSRVA